MPSTAPITNRMLQTETQRATQSPSKATANQTLLKVSVSPVALNQGTKLPSTFPHPSSICQSQKLVYRQMTSRSPRVKNLRKRNNPIPSFSISSRVDQCKAVSLARRFCPSKRSNKGARASIRPNLVAGLSHHHSASRRPRTRTDNRSQRPR